MKRQVFTLIGTILTATLFAQNPTSRIVLAKGQKMVVTTTVAITSSNMGVEALVNTTSENTLEVKQATDKDYTISSTLTKMKLSMDAPGNTTSYDSEKKEDQETEMGKSMSEKLNKPTDITISNTTGAALSSPKPEKKKESDDVNPGMGLLNMLGESGSDEAVARKRKVSGEFSLF